MRLIRVPRRRPGRLPSLGHDHERGHLGYVANLDPASQAYLRTKPFRAPPNHELAECLHIFAHIVEMLSLDVRSQVLDAGCGPGWLTEFLARCGYWVTGIDVSPAMIEVARERVVGLPGQAGPGIAPLAELHVMRADAVPWRRRFDAIVLYDAMHHFDGELRTLAVLRQALVPGGALFIHEGARPRRGSAEEAAFVEEMRQRGTLESPFDPAYLVGALRGAGFVEVRRLTPIDRAFEVRRPHATIGHLLKRTIRPRSNTIVARSPGAPGPAGFAVDLRILGRPRAAGDVVRLDLAVANTGLRYWPAAERHPFPVGSVSVAPYVRREHGDRLELPRQTLGAPLACGERRDVTIEVPTPSGADGRMVHIDLVREGIAWFEDLGGTPLAVELPA